MKIVLFVKLTKILTLLFGEEFLKEKGQGRGGQTDNKGYSRVFRMKYLNNLVQHSATL